jgi:hypothetical protein
MPRLSCLILLLLPAGCAWSTYVSQPPGPWSGAPEPNDWNLHVMVANPGDLSHGQAMQTSLATESVAPIRRLLSGQRTPLMAISAEQLNAIPTAPSSVGGSAGQQQ